MSPPAGRTAYGVVWLTVGVFADRERPGVRGPHLRRDRVPHPALVLDESRQTDRPPHRVYLHVFLLAEIMAIPALVRRVELPVPARQRTRGLRVRVPAHHGIGLAVHDEV